MFGDGDELRRALAMYEKDVATDPALGDEPSEDFMWIHRHVDGRERYFVAAGTNGWRGKVTFRAQGEASVFDPVSLERTAWRNGVIYDLGQPEKDRKTRMLDRKGFSPRPTDPYGAAGIIGPVVLEWR